MPKYRKKGKGRGVESNSDDESLENASVYSLQSENAGSIDEGSDEVVNQTEKFEEKFLQALDNAIEKSAQTRVQALQVICDLLMHRFMPDFIDDRKLTIIDIVEKSVRRGKGAEQAYGARLATLLIMQLGGSFDMIKPLNQYLLTAALDKSISFDARAKCCTALGLLNFLSSDDIGELLQLMQNFETIFSGSYLKGDNTPSAATAEAGTLHSAALSAWGLILTLIPPGDFISIINSQRTAPTISNLQGMLKSPHLDVRMAVGETLALVLECGRCHNEEFLDDVLPDLIDSTKQLATDSNKYRAKRDRKTQRATFRDVLRYLEEDISPEISIRFGKETFIIDSWATHHQYTALCSVMGPGMTIHLAENDFIRDVLQLGEKILPDVTGTANKQTKLERHLVNAAAFKARTLSRSKNRDKRNVCFN